MRSNISLLIIMLTLWGGLNAQDSLMLSKEKAVNIALENNYQIILANDQLSKAKNQTSVYNSGMLPTVNASAGANYNYSNGETEFSNGNVVQLSGAESNGSNAGVGVNYVIFNGFNRKYTIQQLMEVYNLTEEQSRMTTENVMLQVFLAYFEVARLQENYINLQEALKISKNRLSRAQYGQEYGQSNYLDVSNALVDVNTDSINILNVRQQLENSKRNLNVLLGRDVETVFQIDTSVVFQMSMTKDELELAMEEKNAALNIARKGLSINHTFYKIQQSSLYPQLSANAGYSWSHNNNNASSPVSSSNNNGMNAGLTLSWSLFDGGARYIRQRNALIDIRMKETEIVQVEQELLRDFNNAWGNYNNSLFVLSAQEDNLKTNKMNFQRTEELYRIGRVSSIEFRQAQLNLLNAQTNRNQAKYQAKLAEMELLQISGLLLETEI